MTQFVLANNVATTITSAVAPSDTTIALASSAHLPVLPTGSIFPITLNDKASGLVYEVLYCTAISGAMLTVMRGQEGTTAKSWALGDYAFSTVTAATAAVSGGNPLNTFGVATATAPAHATPLAQVQALVTAGTAGVSSFNSRTGTVTLSSTDVSGALGYTPANQATTLTNPMTTNGDMLFQQSSVPSRLPIGANGQVLTVSSGLPVWGTPASGGGGDYISVFDFGAKGDGVTDDSAAINAAIVANAKKNIVVIPGGHTFCVGSSILLVDDTYLMVLGIIQMKSGSRCTIIEISNASRCVVCGAGILDGNVANIGTGTSLVAGIANDSSGGYCNDILVDGLTIKNTNSWPVNITYANRAIVSRCKMYNGGHSVEFALNANDCWFLNNYVNGINDLGIGFYGTCTGGGAIGNTVVGCVSAGVFCLADSAQPGISTNILLQDNFIHDITGDVGIVVASNVPNGTVFHKNIMIKNNMVRRCQAGVYVNSIDPTGTVSIKGNTIIDCYNGSSSAAWNGAISVGSLGGGVVDVTDNTIIDIAGQTYRGIFLSGVSNTTVARNTIQDYKSTPTIVNNIYGSLISKCVVKDNFVGATTGASPTILFASVGSNCVVHGNFDLIAKSFFIIPLAQNTNFFPGVTLNSEGTFMQSGTVTIPASSITDGTSTQFAMGLTIGFPINFPNRMDSLQLSIGWGGTVQKYQAYTNISLPAIGQINNVPIVFTNNGPAAAANVTINWFAMGR